MSEASVGRVRAGAATFAARRVCDLPAEDRPRERLARHGVSALSNRELLALLVGTGARGASVLDVAEKLLGSGLRGLAGRSLSEVVEPSDVQSILQECGKSHWTKSVVRYHCFAIPE